MFAFTFSSSKILIAIIITISVQFTTVTTELFNEIAANDEALFLTPYITSGNISAARNAAEVKPLVGNVSSYAGFLTVDSRFNSNLFVWFFPRNTSSWQNSPTVLWLQGGPGASSLYGLFEEIGPYVFKQHGRILAERYYSWTTDVNLLFVDNPVGSGFSFTESEDGYANNQTAVSENLYVAIRQFYQLFPELQKNRLVLAGESYAGKYVPYLAATIHHKNKHTEPRINLYGLFIGNPMIEGERMLRYNDYLYWIGLLDRSGQQIVAKEEELVMSLIKSGKWEEAADKFGRIFFESLGRSTFQNLTGFNQHYHLLLKTNQSSLFSSFVQRPSIRNAIHVGNLPWNRGRKAYDHLKNDILRSSRHIYEHLLQHYKILIYAGQLDIICPFYLVENVVRHFNWKYASQYETADRQIFRVDQYLAGYYKTVDKLTTVLIRNAGHMVPKDKSQWARRLVRRFIYDKF